MVVLLGCAVTPQQAGNMSDLLAQIKTLFGRVFFFMGLQSAKISLTRALSLLNFHQRRR